MIYDVDLDDGRTVTLEADNPPSEQDIYAALQSYQPPKSDLENLSTGVNAATELFGTVNRTLTNPATIAAAEAGQEQNKAEAVDLENRLLGVPTQLQGEPPLSVPKPAGPAAEYFTRLTPVAESIGPIVKPTNEELLTGVGSVIEEPKIQRAGLLETTGASPIGLAKFQQEEGKTVLETGLHPAGEEGGQPGIAVPSLYSLAISQLPEGTVKRMGAGAHNALASFLNFFGSPQGWATLGTGNLPGWAQRAITAKFATDMLRSAPQQFMAGADALDRGDIQGATENWLGGIGSTVFAGVLAKHTAQPFKLPSLGETPTKAGETYASPIRSDTGQILEAGQIPETSENVSGQNLQLTSSRPPEPVGARVEPSPPPEVVPAVESPEVVRPERGLPENATESDLMADMTKRGREFLQRLKATPDEFSDLDATGLSAADRRNLARLGVVFFPDRTGKKIGARWPQDKRAEEIRAKVLAKRLAEPLPPEQPPEVVSPEFKKGQEIEYHSPVTGLDHKGVVTGTHELGGQKWVDIVNDDGAPVVQKIQDVKPSTPPPSAQPSETAKPPELMTPKERHPNAPDVEADIKIASEKTSDIVKRTKVGDERDKAFSERRAAAVRLANTLRPGDSIVGSDGTTWVIEDNLGKGQAFVKGGGDSIDVAILLGPDNYTDAAGVQHEGPAGKIVRGDSKTDIHDQSAAVSGHLKEVRQAIRDKKPVNAEAVAAYGLEGYAQRNGYVREGDRYVYKPTTPSETAAVTKTPVSAEPETPPVTPEAKSPPPPEPKAKEQIKAASKIQSEVSKVAKTEGVRSAKDIKAELVARLEKAIEDAPSDSEFNTITGKPITDIAKKAKPTISINIPDDGDFTIINRKENVASILAQAKRISTTSGTPPIVPRTKAIGDIADQAEAAAKAYGSPEAAYLSAKRQRDELQQQGPPANAEDRKIWNDQIENADYLIREIYGNTKAAKLEADAEAARDRVATYKEGAKGFEKEIARIEAIKRKTAAHKERLDDLKERYAQNQSFIKMNERNADNWEQQAAQEKAKLGIELLAPASGSVGSVGPGAASPGDVPKQAQIEQLTAAFKNINAQKVPLLERIKQAFDFGKQRDLSRDLIGRTLSALKTSGDYLADTWKGVNDVDPILKVKGQLSSELELRGWRMRQAMKDMKRVVPDIKIREAISKWVDAGGDLEVLRNAAETVPANRRAAYERALQLTPEEKIFAEHIKSYFESRLQEAKDAGVLENGIEDYIHRIYPRETPWRKGVLNAIQNGVLNTRRPGLAMKRVFEFDSEAEKAGLKPVGDFIPRVLDYEASLSKVIASREAVKRFTEIKMPDGRPMLDTAGIGMPIEGAEGVREATLIKPSFKPGEHQIGTDGKPTLNYRKDYQARDYGALKKWKWATKDENGNPIFVQGDVLIHPDAVHRIDALLEPSKIRKYAAARAALAVGSTFKQTMLDFSGFHQVQIAIHGLEHKVNPFNLVKDIDAENPNVRGLLRGGVTLGGEHVTGMAQEGLVGRSLSRQIPGLGPLMQTYHSWLFQDFIPRVKMTMALHALERNRSRFAKDLASGKMTEDALFYQTAKEANAAFGELNYVMLERSKTAQDMARMILLAPDFLEARGRFVGQSLTKPGGEQRMALLLGALALYTTARVMNKAISGEYHNEPENLFSVVHNGKAYSIRTVQGDVLHAIEEPVKFWLHRLNPTMTRPLFELLSGRDEFGRKRSFWQVMGDTISNIVPISMRHGREQSIWTSLLNAFGGSVRRNSEVRRIYDAAQEWKKANNIRTEPGEFIYDPSQDIYRPLKLAILDGDTGTAMLEYRKLIDSKVVTPKQASEHFSTYARSPFSGSRANEAKFYNSLSEDEKKSYEGAKQEKQRILQGFIKAGGMSPKPVQLKPITRQK